jgi:heptosyltransferase-2
MAAPRYLLIRFSSLGDVVLATAAARHIKQRRPDARVAFATKAAFAPVLLGQPDIDEVWPLGPAGMGPMLNHAWAVGVERVVDLHGSLRARVLAALAPARVSRWQARTLDRRRLVWKLGPPPRPAAPVAWRYVAAAADALGEAPPAEAPLPRLVAAPEAAEWAGAWLAQRGVGPGRPLLAVSPGAAWPTKRWPLERLAQCLRLVAAGGEAGVLLLGSPAEAPLLDALVQAVGPLPAALLRADAETGDLRRLVALIARSSHFLGHDSGPMHVAEALGVPLTALFGPTVRGFGFYPVSGSATVIERDLACRPCHLHGGLTCPLGHHDCLAGIEPGPVAEHLRRALALGN